MLFFVSSLNKQNHLCVPTESDHQLIGKSLHVALTKFHKTRTKRNFKLTRFERSSAHKRDKAVFSLIVFYYHVSLSTFSFYKLFRGVTHHTYPYLLISLVLNNSPPCYTRSQHIFNHPLHMPPPRVKEIPKVVGC